jgi:flavocytochrome c
MNTEQIPVKWNQSTDVIVIGSGFAGLSAAMEAAEAGAEVVVLEKMKVKGGNSKISDGALAVAGSYLHERYRVKDTPELMQRDMVAAGLGLNHPELVELVTRESENTLRWTIDHLGVRYMDRVDQFGGHSVARSVTTHNNSGAAIVRKQLAHLSSLQVDIRTKAHLTSILRDSEGVVRGVAYQDGYLFNKPHSGQTVTLAARKAVILATGGFGADVPFRVVQDPRLDEKIGHTNHRGATAEGLIAALKLGATPVHLSWIQLGPWACADEKGFGRGSSFVSYAVFSGGIIVNPETGERFVNELADRKVRADAILNTGRTCIGVVDAAGAARGEDKLATCLKRGYVRKFDSLNELAEAYGIPGGRFLATVERFNRAFKDGKDEMGKPLLQDSGPIVNPPFFGVRIWPKVHYTMGGIRINPRAEVIDLTGRPIPRLFAAGEVTGGFHGASRMGSCAIPECLTMGRVAGKSAVKV